MTSPSPTPNMLGPYRLLDSLGQGGMGRVFQAQHTGTGQVVALKTIKMVHTKFMHQIRREVHALSQLRHPGIVSIVDHGVHNGQPWYAMEMIHGVTLRDWMHQSPPGPTAPNQPAAPASDPSNSGDSPLLSALPTHWEHINEKLLVDTQEGEGWWADTVAEQSVLRQHVNAASLHSSGQDQSQANVSLPSTPPTRSFRVCEPKALQQTLEMTARICQPLFYLHGEGIIHCDLKPNNILIRDNGWPIIIDFGLLTQFSNAVSRESLDTLQLGLGTLPYMAPEQLKGQLLDARADLYALGCMLYEWLTGAPPFVGDPESVVSQHLFEKPLPPSHWVQGLPPALDQLVLRLLAKKPHERMGYADTVRHTLLSILRMQGYLKPVPWPGLSRTFTHVYLYRPKLAGRQATFEQLTQHLSPLHEGGGSLVLMKGESGVGKTRLFLELAGHAMNQGIKVLTGECLEAHPEPLSLFQPLLQLLADRAQQQDSTEREAMLGPDAWALLPYNKEMPSISGQQPNPALLDLKPQQAHFLVSRALRHSLCYLTATHPFVVLFDDLQWADPFSLHVLQHLAKDPPPHVLWVTAYRSEEETEALQELSSLEQVTSISLERLNHEAVGSMVRDMLALSEIPTGFSQYLATHSEGNPFFVAEYLRSAINERMLWRNPQGVWQFGNHATALEMSPYDSQLPLPPSLQELLQRRLQDVSPQASEVLAAASILGREAPIMLLQTLTRFSWEPLWSVLEELRRRELLEDSSPNTVRFVHDKLREEARRQVLPEQAQAFHHLAASAIEANPEHFPNATLADVATHWKEAGEPDQARYKFKQAAEFAKKQYANDEAIACYQSYLELETKDIQEGIEVRIAMGDLLRLVGKGKDAESIYKQAVAMAQKIGLRKQEGDSLTQLGLLYWHTGKLDQAEPIFNQSLTIHREQHNRRGEGLVLGYFAGLSYYRGDMTTSKQRYEAALDLHRKTGNREAEGRELSNLGNIFLEGNELQKARSYYEAALQTLDDPKSLRYRIMVLNNLAHVFFYQHDLEQAGLHYTEMLQRARQVGDRASEGMALGNLAHTRRDQGYVEEALRLFDEANEIHRKLNNRLFEAIHRIQQLVLERLLGHPPLSLKATVLRAKTILESTGNTFYQALVECEAGHLELVHLRSAETHLKRAIKQASAAGITPNAPSEVGVALSRLQRAQEAFLNDLFLYCGQRIQDIPEGLQQRLRNDGHL